MKREDVSSCLDDGAKRELLGVIQRQRAPGLLFLCLLAWKVIKTPAHRYPRMSKIFLQAQGQDCTSDVSIRRVFYTFCYTTITDIAIFNSDTPGFE